MKKLWIVNKINPGQAEILLYGYIGPYDMSASDFIIDLSQLASTYQHIKIRINSGGGSVFEGIAIYNAIRSMIKSGKNITTAVDGIAASMASVIAVAGKSVTISKYGRMMTHRANGFASGDADQMRQQAQLVEDAEEDIVKIFAARTDMSAEDVKAKLIIAGTDTWLNAAKCVEMGLADEVYDADPVQVPENVKDEKQLHNIFDTCLNKSNSQTTNSNMKKIAKKLGLSEDATEDQIINAIEKIQDAKTSAEAAVQNAAQARADALVNDAIDAKKITADKKDAVIKMALSDYDGTKDMLDLIPVAKKPTDVINRSTQNVDSGDEAAPAVTDKAGEGWDKLIAQGMSAVEKVKKETPELYAKLYKDKFHRHPTEMGFSES